MLTALPPALHNKFSLLIGIKLSLERLVDSVPGANTTLRIKKTTTFFWPCSYYISDVGLNDIILFLPHVLIGKMEVGEDGF